MTDVRQEADELFIDVLLEHVLGGGEAARSHRLERTLQQISSEHWSQAQAEVPVRRAWRPIAAGFLTTAAAVLLAVTALHWRGASATAETTIDRAIAAMSSEVDRRYTLQLEQTRLGTRTRREGELFVRGTSSLAVRVKGDYADLWAGESASGAWLVPANLLLPVVTGPRGSIVRLTKVGDDSTLPLLRLTRALQRLKRAYDLRVRHTEAGSQEVTATLKPDSNGDDWPTTIVFEADRVGVIQALQMDWMSAQRQVTQREITQSQLTQGQVTQSISLRLEGSSDVPDGFYEHSFHHGGRPVVRFGSDR